MNITTLRIGCSNCNLREVCMPLGLTLKDMETVEELVSAAAASVAARRSTVPATTSTISMWFASAS